MTSKKDGPKDVKGGFGVKGPGVASGKVRPIRPEVGDSGVGGGPPPPDPSRLEGIRDSQRAVLKTMVYQVASAMVDRIDGKAPLPPRPRLTVREMIHDHAMMIVAITGGREHTRTVHAIAVGLATFTAPAAPPAGVIFEGETEKEPS